MTSSPDVPSPDVPSPDVTGPETDAVARADEAVAPSGDPGLRTLVRVGIVGTLLSVLVAVVVGVAAGSGRSALAMLLLVGALTTATVGLVGTVTMLRDEFRGTVRPGRARIVLTIGGFLVTTLLLAMVVGVASTSG